MFALGSMCYLSVKINIVVASVFLLVGLMMARFLKFNVGLGARSG